MENLILDADFAELITKLGDRFRDIGNITESISYIEQAKEIYLKLGNESYFIACLERIGHIYIQIGELEKGFSMICEADEKMKRLCNQFPDNLDYKETQSIIYQRVGDYRQQIGHINEALISYQKEYLIKKELHKHYVSQNDKAKTQYYTNLLATSLLRLGVIAQKNEGLEDAISYFEEIEKLYQEYPVGGISADDRQGGAYIYLGEIKFSQNKKDDTFMYYDKALKLYEKLSQNNPPSPVLDNYCLACQKMGIYLSDEQKFLEAMPYFEKSRDLSRQICAGKNIYLHSKNNLAFAYRYLGDIQKWHFKNNQEALIQYREAETIWVELCEKTITPDYCQNLADVRKEILSLK